MKFTIDREALADAIAWTARSVPQRGLTTEILTGVRITAEDDGQIEFAAFDREVSAKVVAQGEVDDPGIALVSGRLLSNIAKLLPQRPVTFELIGSKIQITCDHSVFTLLTMPVDEYPDLPVFPVRTGVINAPEFLTAVSQVQVAAGRDEQFPLLTGIRFEIEGEDITMFATDRYRLAKRNIKWTPEQNDYSTAALIKAKTISDIAKTLGTDLADFELSFANEDGPKLVGFSGGLRQATSQLIDGDYRLPIHSLFPEESPITAVVSTPALIDAVRRVSLVAEATAPIILSFTEGQVELTAGRGDDAQAVEVIPAELNGEDINIAFNPQYLLDGLNVLNSDFVRLSMTHPIKPVDFTGQDSLDGENDDSFRYLLVPIRVAV